MPTPSDETVRGGEVGHTRAGNAWSHRRRSGGGDRGAQGIVGHPDTICDAVMERISQALSKAYLEHFGAILHHNCNKGLLVAGQVQRHLGGGRIVEPMSLIIGDRATTSASSPAIAYPARALAYTPRPAQHCLCPAAPRRPFHSYSSAGRVIASGCTPLRQSAPYVSYVASLGFTFSPGQKTPD
jgi:S-adenosylmethionine synthetase (AdoMet synthetase)